MTQESVPGEATREIGRANGREAGDRTGRESAGEAWLEAGEEAWLKAGEEAWLKAGVQSGRGLTPRQPGAGLGLATAANLRDLGGWPTRDGRRVVSGAIYRSTDLSRLAGPDVQAFAELGIRSVYDLRTELERTSAPDVLPSGAVLHVLDVLADSAMAVPADLMALLADPPVATRALTADRVTSMMDAAYREIVSLPSARASYRTLFSGLSAADRRPALIHCTAGKDRTGWAVAALLLLLGVSDEDVLTEYMLTNELLLPVLQPVLEQFQEGGGDPAVLVPVLGVDPAYLEAALDEVATRFGSLEGYLVEGLGLNSATLEALRDMLTESAG